MSTAPLAIVVLAATLAYAALQARLHLATTGYSPVHNAVSDYGVGGTRRTFRMAAVANGVALVALADAMIAHGTPLVSLPVELLVVAFIARIVVAVVPTDLPGARPTATGRVHLAAAVAQFAALHTFLADESAGLVDGSWLALPTHLLVVASGVGLAGVCLGFVPAARRWFGLCERVFLFSSTAAIACCALGLLR